MPYGITITQYLKNVLVTLLASAAGAQTVYMIYKPMDDFPQLVEEEIERIRAEIATQENEIINDS